MNRQWKHWTWAVMMLALLAPARSVPAAQPQPISMLVVPSRYSVLQVAFDVARQFPVVLVAYEGDATTANPQIYAWNGSEWVGVTVPDYQEANFLQLIPSQAILVGDDQLLPPALAEISSWCPRSIRVPALDTATLVNHVGTVLSFSGSDWRWFAARYNLDLEDLNTEQRKMSWYDEPHSDVKAGLKAVPRYQIFRGAAAKQNFLAPQAGGIEPVKGELSTAPGNDVPPAVIETPAVTETAEPVSEVVTDQPSIKVTIPAK